MQYEYEPLNNETYQINTTAPYKDSDEHTHAPFTYSGHSINCPQSEDYIINLCDFEVVKLGEILV